MQIILKEVSNLLMSIEWTNSTKIFLNKRIAELEYRMSLGATEKLQLGSLIGAFNEVRTIKGNI